MNLTGFDANTFKSIATMDCDTLTIHYDMKRPEAKILAKSLAKNKSIKKIFQTREDSSDLLYLEALKKNTTVRLVSFAAPLWNPKLTPIIQKNHSLTAIEFTFSSRMIYDDLEAFQNFIGAISCIGTLESFTMTCNNLTKWPMQTFADVIKNNKSLQSISLGLTHCKMLDTNMVAQALAESNSLTSLAVHAKGLHKNDGNFMIFALKGNPTITSLEFPDTWMTNNQDSIVEALVSLPALHYLKLETRDGSDYKCDISPLIVKKSPLNVLDCDMKCFYNDKIREILLDSTSLTRINISNDDVNATEWKKLNKVVKYNYHLDISTDAYSFSNQRSYLQKLDLKHEFKKLSKMFFKFQVTQLPKDRGFFEIIPNEILMTIFGKILFSTFGDHIGDITLEEQHVARLIEMSRRRDLLQKSRYQVVKLVWLTAFDV